MRQVIVVLSPRHDLYHSGYLLSAAVRAGARIRIEPGVHPLVPWVEADGRICAVDLWDSSLLYHESSLAKCDTYFKRSYVRTDVPAAYRNKVRPFGLNYSCRTLGSLLQVLSVYGRRWTMPDTWKNYLLSAPPEAYEVLPTDACDAVVLFQTRVWPLEETDPEHNSEDINAYRVQMVRELKRAFGNRFVGGLVPNPEGLSYPDLVTNMPTRRREYAAWSRRPAIGIYTRGIHGSNAFKVAEYLAASKCIVGQSLLHELPQALGECHSVRETVEETVAECDALLSNPSRLGSMRRASWQYYQSQLHYHRRLALLLAGNISKIDATAAGSH